MQHMLVDSAPHAASRTGAEPLLLPLPRVTMREDCIMLQRGARRLLIRSKRLRMFDAR